MIRFASISTHSRRRRRFSAAEPLLLLLSLSLPVLAGTAALAADPMPDIAVVAAAVRTHGMPCEQPQTVVADRQADTRLEKTWILRCTQGTYRVVFLGDRGSKVERLE